MLDALRADQRIGDFAHGASLAAHHQDLQAIVVIQMHMQRGENRVDRVDVRAMLDSSMLDGLDAEALDDLESIQIE